MKILLVDDHRIVAEALEVMLSSALPDIEVSVCYACEDALAWSELDSIDVILLDFYLSGTLTELDALKALKDAAPNARVVVLSSLTEPAMIHEIIEAGASGFIPKSEDFDGMRAALDAVADGQTYLPDFVLYAELPATQTESGPNADAEYDAKMLERIEALTRRQKQTLDLLVTGNTNKELARELEISVHTVKRHVSDVLAALGLKSRTEAVYLVARLKWRYQP